MQKLEKRRFLPTGREKPGPAANPFKGKLVFLDTCYIISLAKSGYPIKESFERLGNRTGSELVVTGQVMDELERICSERRVEKEDGSLVLGRRALEEVKALAYSGSGVLSKEEVCIGEADREEAKGVLIRNSEKRNSRVGEGELSIWVAVKALKDLFECAVMSIDSDVKALMKSFAEEG